MLNSISNQKPKPTVVLLFILFLGLPTAHCSAQRLELPAIQEQQVIPIGSEGVLLISKPSKTNVAITKYDTNLQKVWAVNTNLEDNLTYEGFSQDNRAIFLLFSKFKSNLYEIVKVNIGPGFIQKFSIETVSRVDISEFKVSKGIAYIAGAVKNEPILLKLDLDSGKTKIFSGAMKSVTASIQSIDIDSTTQDVNVSYSVKKKQNSYMVVKRFDQAGNIISQISVEPDEEYGLLTGKLFSVGENTQIMLGNYGFRGASSNGVPLSQGVYLCKIENNQAQAIKYYSFTDFRNFFEFMSEKEQARIEKQIERKKGKGSDLKLNYRLLVHNIIQKDNEYILVAEAFVPEFRYNNNNMNGFGPYSSLSGFYNPMRYSSMMLYNPYYFYRGFNSWAWNPWLWGNGFGNNQQVFDGFRYTHAVVAGFDTNGKLLWDNSIGFDNLKSMELKEKIHVSPDENNLKLTYSNRGKLMTKTVRGNQVLADVKSIAISSDHEGDKVKATNEEDTEFWYDNYYIAWGLQRITNENEGKRNVFFINKIAY